MKIMYVFGTRPETVKLTPLIKKTKHPVVCVTGQHREMLHQTLKLFKVKPSYDLKVMKKGQTLGFLTASLIAKLEPVMKKEKPDVVVVQGDTTSSFAGALSAFYQKIPVAHVEAGLRTENKYEPFPEEIYRRLITQTADLFFPPTKESAKILLDEGIERKRVVVTGNTGIDALMMRQKEIKKDSRKYWEYFGENYGIVSHPRMILVTGHRRENFGAGMKEICLALRDVAKKEDVLIVYPVHLNPNVQQPVKEILGGISNVKLIPPQDYNNFLHLMYNSFFIITDSGGVQEEAPSLGKPLLVMRNVTERPEGVAAGNAVLVGTDRKKIASWSRKLLHDKRVYGRMSHAGNPYGDGKASARILKAIYRFFR